MKTTLTQYKNTHQDYIWKTYVNAMKPHIEKIWGWDLIWQKDDFAKTLDKYTTAIILLDKKQIGYAQYIQESEYLYINMIILQSDYQSQGIGAKLLKVIGSIESDLPIKLKCFRVNDAAYNFYLNNGFEVIKTDNEFFTLTNA